jgi:large subunit ribosomal protein L21
LYAVIETGGKQHRVTEGDVVFLERLDGEPGDKVRFDKILACSNEIDTDFGKPYLSDVSVEAKILGHGKNKKIVVFKFKAKKGYRRKQGHRQPYTKIRIERIVSGKYGVAEYVEVKEDDEAVNAKAAIEDAAAADAAAKVADIVDTGGDAGGISEADDIIEADEIIEADGIAETVEIVEADETIDVDNVIDVDDVIEVDNVIDVDDIIEVVETADAGDSADAAEAIEADDAAGEDKN